MIYVGTAGYSYKDWIGPFYPEGTKDVQMLDYYALHFNFVEVNSSFYHMPSLKLFKSMNRKTPDGFKFAIKLFGGFTHERNIGTTEADRFKYALGPITESGKLVCLLAQFPFSFHCTVGNVKYLKKLGEMFRGYEINVEFRNSEWAKDKVYDMLKESGFGYVCVDEPDVKGLIKNEVAVTSPIAYLRLHGRNADKWYGSKGSERYNYLYTQNELLEWTPRIKALSLNAPITVVSFNNHPIGKAITNAKMLQSILENT